MSEQESKQDNARQDSAKQDQNGPTRRDVLYLTTAMIAGIGVVSTAWPFIDQMNPDAATLAAGEPIEIDVSTIEPGAALIVKWRGKPYFIRHLTDSEIESADELKSGDMKDYAPVDSRVGGPDDRAKKWVIVSANCTHLGCIPKVVDSKPEGWFCPCHGSVFDTIGRILRGPAPINLPSPPFSFASNTKLIIGTDQA